MKVPQLCPALCDPMDCSLPGSSVHELVRGQVNMADEAKLHSSIHSTFEALVVRHEFGYCGGEELGPLY